MKIFFTAEQKRQFNQRRETRVTLTRDATNSYDPGYRSFLPFLTAWPYFSPLSANVIFDTLLSERNTGKLLVDRFWTKREEERKTRASVDAGPLVSPFLSMRQFLFRQWCDKRKRVRLWTRAGIDSDGRPAWLNCKSSWFRGWTTYWPMHSSNWALRPMVYHGFYDGSNAMHDALSLDERR